MNVKKWRISSQDDKSIVLEKNYRIEGIHGVQCGIGIEEILRKFDHLFSSELGRYTGPPVELKVDQDVPPVRLPPRRIPYALIKPYEEELDRLCSQGILEPVEYSEWATPTVPIVKKDGSIRICGDYKSTLNRAVQPHCHQIPAINTLLASIEGGSIFAKIDLAQAYQQLVVDENTALMQTITTHKGAFKVTRLQFGISSAPGIFQSCIERILQNISGVLPYFDDIVIMGKSEEELASRLNEVLTRMDQAGLRLRKEKCQFGVSSIEFLGFKVDALGIRPSADKVKAIHEAPPPKEKKQLQAFLGLTNFYHSFLPKKATIAEPLHRLLDKNVPWTWRPVHQKAFAELKSLIIHYSPDRPLILTCDASPYGLGAVLSHEMEDGTEKPIAFYSRTLSKSERNYAQIDREAVALVAGVKKFHNYLYGRKFTLITDHRPLLGIFSTEKPIPQIISNTMMRRAFFLRAYKFNLIHQPGTKISNADFLSRCPTAEVHPEPQPEEVLMIEWATNPTVTASTLATNTSKDSSLRKVLNWVLRGWSSVKVQRYDDLYPFFIRRNELTSNQGILFWGNRAVIPFMDRQEILSALHAHHPGIVRMKALARSYVWWPGLDADIEKAVSQCLACQHTRNSPPRSDVHHWESAKKPWSRLHIDFAGPFQGNTFFLVVDSFTKWLEVCPVKSTSASAAITFLRQLFATHGIPDEIVSDNGTAFTSEEFKLFTKNNRIRHIRSAPFHPATNGQAERMVQTTKSYLKKLDRHTDINIALARFLFDQHTTPHSVTKHSPAELLFNRELQTFFDKLSPGEISYGKVCEAQTQKSFVTGTPVWVRNYASGPKWIEGQVSKRTGPISYSVCLEDDRTVRRHLDQLRMRSPTQQPTSEEISSPTGRVPPTQTEAEAGEPTTPVGPQRSPELIETGGPPRRSARDRRRPQFYDPSGC
ncbi:uncharacterized protein K02A2.6-like [Drosophila ficusphila]|uniref:uncharacterized protein K02A2.6-like n=1 Tax=Drosophila ficusphila TaxID=30025 RepID=UPI001C89DD31|nr:uncharacterized protein K02A2.6-like [Drosophila ficusphila]